MLAQIGDLLNLYFSIIFYSGQKAVEAKVNNKDWFMTADCLKINLLPLDKGVLDMVNC
jgi:hypothetical protein